MDARIVKQSAPRQALLRELIQPLYDTTEPPVTATAFNLLQWFLRPIGQPMPITGNVKTEADTNMTSASRLGNPNRFEMVGFQYKFMIPDPDDIDQTAADMVDMYQQSVFTFFWGPGRPEWQFPLDRLPTSTILTGNVAGGDITGNVEFGFLHNGPASVKEYWDVTIRDDRGQPMPVKIGPEENFYVEASWPNGAVTFASADQRRCIMLLVGSLFTQL